MSIPITLVAEDSLSMEVAQKILQRYGFVVVSEITHDKDRIRKLAPGLNRSARGSLFFILTDQDTQANCPPGVVAALPGGRHPNLLYRFAVMTVEAWLLADRFGLAEYLQGPLNKVPNAPESLDNPKESLVALARGSGSGHMKRGMLPDRKRSFRVGGDYNSLMREFVKNHWDMDAAARRSPSLRRALLRVRELQATLGAPAA